MLESKRKRVLANRGRMPVIPRTDRFMKLFKYLRDHIPKYAMENTCTPEEVVVAVSLYLGDHCKLMDAGDFLLESLNDTLQMSFTITDVAAKDKVQRDLAAMGRNRNKSKKGTLKHQ